MHNALWKTGNAASSRYPLEAGNAEVQKCVLQEGGEMRFVKQGRDVMVADAGKKVVLVARHAVLQVWPSQPRCLRKIGRSHPRRSER